MRMRVRAFSAVFAATLMLAFAAFSARPSLADTEGHFDRTLTVTGPVDMDVQTGSGSITVHAGGAGKVEIHARIRANGWHLEGDVEQRVHDIEQNPPIEQDGNTIRIGHTDDRERFHNISISYEITTPAETKLHSSSGSGDVHVDGVNGPTEANSGSGSVRLNNIGGETQAHSGSGDIEMDSIKGNAVAKTGSGSVHAMGIAGAFTGSSGSGDIRFEQTSPGDVDVSSGSGSIEIKGAKGAVKAQTGSGNITAQGDPTGEWKLRTGSGSVDVEFPEQAAYELVAHTSSGSIHTNHEMTVQGTISPRELRGKVHGGGPVVDLSTSSGSIEIR
jgi:DUF4097 and DUF4098 domain-containing protein YvlB